MTPTITSLPPTKIKRLYKLSTELSELSEDLLEDLGYFSDEFVRGIQRSLKEARQGKLTKIESLLELE